MNIHFWGVRGSLPAPLTPQQVRAKISAAIQRIQPKDLVSEDARERFIASLPAWIYGTTGGNTSCLEVTAGDGTKIILDAGTGLRMMGKCGEPPENLTYNMLLSHFHWDHIQGLPFFEPLFNPKTTLNVFSPFKEMESYLSLQMNSPFFPITMDACTKNINYELIEEGKEFSIGSAKVKAIKMSHPGASYAYSLTENGHKFIYATDVELNHPDFVRTKEHDEFFNEADVLVIDSQYTVEEAYAKQGWGHSAFCYAIDFAVAWKVKKVFLFHHDPMYDDRKLNSILQSAHWYADYSAKNAVEVNLAMEGLDIKL